MSTNPDSSVPAVVSAPTDAPASSGKITQAELEAHGTQKDMWLLISGKGPSTPSIIQTETIQDDRKLTQNDCSSFCTVYDCTSFMDEHPGGTCASPIIETRLSWHSLRRGLPFDEPLCRDVR
jgi:hypothetical protein